MPRSKNPDRYPDYFKNLLFAAYTAQEPIDFPTGNALEANRMRQQLYAYIRAVETEEERNAVTRPMRLSIKFHKVSFKCVTFASGEVGLRFTNINTNEVAMMARRFLAENPHLDTTDHEAEDHKAAAVAAMEAAKAETEYAAPATEPDLRALFPSIPNGDNK